MYRHPYRQPLRRRAKARGAAAGSTTPAALTGRGALDVIRAHQSLWRDAFFLLYVTTCNFWFLIVYTLKGVSMFNFWLLLVYTLKGVTMCNFWSHFGADLGTILVPFWCIWYHFGTMLVPFWCRFGADWGVLGGSRLVFFFEAARGGSLAPFWPIKWDKYRGGVHLSLFKFRFS